MKKTRISSLIGIIFLITAAVAGVVFVSRETDFLPRAAPEYVPQKVNITNISDTSFTASWVTQEPTIGFVRLGLEPTKLTETYVDDRDQLTGSSGQFRTHYITVMGLSPDTTYYAKLGSQGNKLYDENGQPFSITTAKQIADLQPADTAYGTVHTPAGTPAEGALVYLAFPENINAVPLSALVKQNGSYSLPLSTARTKDFSGYAVYDPLSTPLSLLVRYSLDQDATAITTTGNDQPIPTIILGQNHDFTTQAPPNTPNLDPTPMPESKFSIKPIDITDTPDDSLVITTMPRDGMVIQEAQPQIQGRAPAGTILTITVHSSQIYTDSVSVDASGIWHWSPPADLEPGNHTLTVSYNDENGILHTLTRTFIIASAQASSESPTYTSTPSATLSPTRVPTPTIPPPTTATTQIPTPSPLISPTPTLIPTLMPTTPPLLTPTIIPTPPTLPEAGTSTPTILGLSAGFLLLAFGFLFQRLLKIHTR